MLTASLIIYRLVLPDGDSPITSWIESIRDEKTQARIVQRIIRLEQGNFGDHKDFEGIGELRLDFGPGHRIYFARQGNFIVILLGGGNKSGQKRDITLAKVRWEAWKISGRRIEELPLWESPFEENV